MANAQFINTTLQDIGILSTLVASDMAVINASSNSNVNILKSHVVNNSWSNSLVSASNFSSILIEDCVVESNMVAFTLFQSTHYGHIVVNRSNFAKNKIINSYGYCFKVLDNITVHILDTVFYRIQLQILQAEFNISVNFSNCQFVHNIVPCCVLANIAFYGFCCNREM